MKALTIISLFLLLGAVGLCGSEYQGQTQIIDPTAVIFEDPYTAIDEKDPFLLYSDLENIREKPRGASQGEVYRDQKGTVWFVKRPQNIINEYLGAKIMHLLIGPYAPEVMLFAGDKEGEYTSSKKILNFITQEEADTLNEFSNDLIPISEKLKLDFAIYLIALRDDNTGNMRYVRENGLYIPARVDFDFSFQFDATPADKGLKDIIYSNLQVDLESVKIATEGLVSIPNFYIYDAMQKGIRDLSAVGLMAHDNKTKYLKYTIDIIKRKSLLAELNSLVTESIQDNTLENKTMRTLADVAPILSTQLNDSFNLKRQESVSWVERKWHKQEIENFKNSHEFRAIKREVAFIREAQDRLEKDYLRQKETIDQQFEQKMAWIQEMKSQIEVEEIAIKKRVTSLLTSHEMDWVLRREFDLEMQERQAIRDKDMELNNAMD